MPRLFTAIEVPTEIGEGLRHLHLPLPGARWIQPGNYHITLRFVGDISNSDAREFAANLARIEPDGFELRFTGVGVFGGDHPHAIWAALEPNPKLDELAKLHEKAARAARLPPETRAFKPHVTLARLKHSSAEAVARFLTRFSSYRSDPFFVARTVLMSSKPMSGGGPYGIEDRFPMRGMEFLSEDGEANW